LLDQACAHCPIFPTAASRRSLGRVSVPVWLAVLSDQLTIVALVGHYPTNQLIVRRPLVRRISALTLRSHAVLAPVSRGYPPPNDTFLRAPHPSATDSRNCPCDLHVLSMPPAFALSQDQTLRFIKPEQPKSTPPRGTPRPPQPPTTNTDQLSPPQHPATTPTTPRHLARQARPATKQTQHNIQGQNKTPYAVPHHGYTD
jgi:hypothetical protein